MTRTPSTLLELLRQRASEEPHRTAYTFLDDAGAEESALTYAELDERARRIAAALQTSCAPGDRVLLLYPPGLEYIAAFFGCLYAGAVAVPLYPPRRNRNARRLQSVVSDARAATALATARVRSRVEALFPPGGGLEGLRWTLTDDLAESLGGEWREPRVDGDTLAFLQYTSGSTAAPKGTRITHANLLHNEAFIKRAFRQDRDSVVVGWLPLYHDMGLIGNVLQPLYTGARSILFSPASFLQRPLRWLEAITRYRATTSGGPNFAYELCARAVTEEQKGALDLGSWTTAFNGAEPVRPQTLERFARAFEPCGFRRESFFPCYGLAEATLLVAVKESAGAPTVLCLDRRELQDGRVAEVGDGCEEARPLVSCGGSPPEQQVRIVDPETCVACAEGKVGEVWVGGPSVAQGYWNRPEETERTFGARLADTGEGPFLRTGDLGFLHGGELYVTGRLKDLVIIRGVNHYPQDIERTVEESHEELRPDGGAAFSVEEGGEERLVVVQEVSSRHPSDPDEIVGAIRRAVSEEHEVSPHAVVLLRPGSIPKTSSGKIQRHACRAAFLSGGLEEVARREASGAAAGQAAPDEGDTHVPADEPGVETWLRARLAA
ncbi:MAG TPA: fatty acyl-AMP ligase, partial [Pyrinomonadaceae bacterium]